MSGPSNPPPVPRVAAGTAFTPADRRTAEFAVEVVRDELPRIRAAALAWRNGLGALLAGVIGFGLVKGRSDIGELAPAYGAAVGALLALSLAAGVVAALLLLRAAHGRPGPVRMGRLVRPRTKSGRPAGSPDHRETVTSAFALRAGVVLGVACLAFLTGAVGVTWYGPSADSPRVKATTAGTEVCGQVVRAAGGVLTLKRSDDVLVDVRMRDLTALQAVSTCSPPR